jgi:hypothetical protein
MNNYEQTLDDIPPEFRRHQAWRSAGPSGGQKMNQQDLIFILLVLALFSDEPYYKID